MSDKRTVCVAGKNDIACDVLNYLIINYGDNYILTGCCNQTETGLDGWQRSYRAYIKDNGIAEKQLDELYQIDNLIFISTEFDKIIRPIRFNNAALYNIHFSQLPAYRGMYTSALPILHGEKKTGVTLHEIDGGIDTGRIIAQSSFDLLEDMTSRDLYLRYIEEGTLLVIKNMDKLLSGNYEAYEQPVKGASYFSKNEIDYDNLTIDLNRTAYQVQNQLRAFSFREYQLPKILDREIVAWKITQRRSEQKAGTIIWKENYHAIVCTIDYDILIEFQK